MIRLAVNASGNVFVAGSENNAVKEILAATGAIPFAPGSSRLYVHFAESDQVFHGSTSVAIEATVP